MKARLLGSLIIGAIAAAAVAIYDAKANHAALAAAAARNHTTVISSLAGGFACLMLFVAAVVFVAGTVLAGRPQRRQADAGRAFRGRQAPQRRRPRADVWR